MSFVWVPHAGMQRAASSSSCRRFPEKNVARARHGGISGGERRSRNQGGARTHGNLHVAVLLPSYVLSTRLDPSLCPCTSDPASLRRGAPDSCVTLQLDCWRRIWDPPSMPRRRNAILG